MFKFRLMEYTLDNNSLITLYSKTLKIRGGKFTSQRRGSNTSSLLDFSTGTEVVQNSHQEEAKMLHEGTNLLGRRNKIITITDITSLTLKYNEMLHHELIFSTEIQVQIVSDYFLKSTFFLRNNSFFFLII